MSDERWRLFVALSLPGEVRAALSRWGDGIVAAAPGLRAVASDGLHVTLCFLGSLPPASVEAIGAALSGVERRRPARLAVDRALWLPGARRPRVLGVALSDDDGRLGEVQAILATELSRRALYEPERRPFLPHVTVARVRRGAQVRIVDAVAPPPPPPPPPAIAFTGSEVTLYRSRVGPGGSRYEALAGVKLSG